MEIPILYYNVDGSQVFHHEILLQVFEKVGTYPFAVISINGMQKTRKSFLLTQILRAVSPELPEIQWTTTQDEPHVGICIWSQPLPLVNSSGQKIYLILLKTKTSLEPPATLYQNAIVSALSLSLSSLLILNLRKTITKESITFLQYFLNLGKSLTNCASSVGTNYCDTKFQRILFLVHDMDLRVKDFSHGYHSPTSKPPPTAHSQTNLFTQIFKIDPTRQPLEVQHAYRQVLSAFENLGLFALPERPTALSMSLVHQTERALDLEFQNYVHTLSDLIIGLIPLEIKRFSSETGMNGFSFLEVIDIWNRRLSRSLLSSPGEQTRAEMLNQIATTNLLSLYVSTIVDFMDEHGRRTGKSGMYSKTLAEKMNSFLKICLDTFSRRLSQGDEGVKTQYREILSGQIEVKMKLFENLNESRFKYARETVALKNEANQIIEQLENLRLQKGGQSGDGSGIHEEEFERSLRSSIQQLQMRKQSEEFDERLGRIQQKIQDTQAENQKNLDQITNLINNISLLY